MAITGVAIAAVTTTEAVVASFSQPAYSGWRGWGSGERRGTDVAGRSGSACRPVQLNLSTLGVPFASVEGQGCLYLRPAGWRAPPASH